MAKHTTCAQSGCDCEVEGPKEAFVRDGRAYCSSSCAAGQGCSHFNCNCGASK